MNIARTFKLKKLFFQPKNFFSLAQSPKTLKFVCISDTHGLADHNLVIPPGDVLIHAGDFTNLGEPEIIEEFNEWLGQQPHPIKVVIAGNHDICFDIDNYKTLAPKFHSDFPKIDPFKTKALLKNCIYLEDSAITVHGYKIYGSPWVPYYHGWAFNAQKGKECEEIWKKIPTDTEILITHGPPHGILDLVPPNINAGCEELIKEVEERVKPLYHIFGHVHEGYGVLKKGKTTYINASTCTKSYDPINKPVVFELPVKK